MLFTVYFQNSESYELDKHHMLDGTLFPWVSSETMKPTEIKVINSMKHYDIPRSVQYILVKIHGKLNVAFQKCLFLEKNFEVF